MPLVPVDPLNVLAKFEFRSFTRSWDNWEYPKIWAVPGYAHAKFSPKFLMGFCSDGPANVLAKFEVRIASSVPEIIAIGVLGWGCEPQILGAGRGWYRSKEHW